MNSGLMEIAEEIQTKSSRPPQVKSSKTQIQAKFHRIPTIYFEDQKLTSFSGLLSFQALFISLPSRRFLVFCAAICHLAIPWPATEQILPFVD